LVGGALLHVSTSSLLSDTGRVLGISGIAESAILANGRWQRQVVLGLLLGPTLGYVLGIEGIYAGDAMRGWSGISLMRGALAGLLVGFGSRVSESPIRILCKTNNSSGRDARVVTFFAVYLEVLRGL